MNTIINTIILIIVFVLGFMSACYGTYKIEYQAVKTGKIKLLGEFYKIEKM